MNYFKIATLCNSFRIATISSPQSVVTRNYAKAVAGKLEIDFFFSEVNVFNLQHLALKRRRWAN